MGKKDTIQRINLKEPLMNRIESYIQFIRGSFLMVTPSLLVQEI